MRKILVTGSAGFVGAHFVEHILKETYWDVIGLDSFRHRGDSLRVHADLDPDRYEMYAHDLTTPISPRLIEKIGPVDFIVNFASESHVDRSITDPVPFIQNNVNLMLSILEYARIVKPKQFIQISTDEVYGPAHGDRLHDEWSTILPSNPYAASKAAQEAIAISYWRTYGVPLVITNTMNMFGERQDREKFIPMLISKIQKNEMVTIHGDKSSIGSRFYLHSRNHADAILFLLNEMRPKVYKDGPVESVPSRYNVVGDQEVNNLELAQIVSRILGRDLQYEFVDFHSARPGHDRRYALDGSLLKDLGWRAPMPFDLSLTSTVLWTLKNPEWLK